MSLKLLSLSSLHLAGTALRVIRKILHSLSIGIQYRRWGKRRSAALLLSCVLLIQDWGSKGNSPTRNRCLREASNWLLAFKKRYDVNSIICSISLTAHNRIWCWKLGIWYLLIILIAIQISLQIVYVISSLCGWFSDRCEVILLYK